MTVLGFVKINVLKELAFVNFRMFLRVFFTGFFLFRMLEKLRKYKEEKKMLKELSKKQSKPAFKVSIKWHNCQVFKLAETGGAALQFFFLLKKGLASVAVLILIFASM